MEPQNLKWTTVVFLLTFIWWPWRNEVHGQIERAELGKRLQRFELQWAQGNSAQQAAAAQPMQEAVSSFFSLRLLRAAEKLDAAWWTAQSAMPTDFRRFVVAHRIAIQKPIWEATEDSIQVRLEPFYPLECEQEDAQVELTVVQPSLALPLQRPNAVVACGPIVRVSWGEATTGIELDVASLPEGDYEIHASVNFHDASLKLLPCGWSRIRDPGTRIARLREQRNEAEDALAPWLRATSQEQIRVLDSMLSGEFQEIDYPAYHGLAFCEQLLSNRENAADLIRAKAQTRDLWLSVAEGRRKVHLRLRSPTTSDPTKKIPVLILFHGAGGSENMFFETYGAGGAVAAGLERGWLVVATRQSLTGLSLDSKQILEALAPLFPVDDDRVYYLGHSMGAGQVATQVGLHPELPRAVAAIGGGGRPRQIEAAAQVPWFVAAGSLDFGKGGAISLSKSLQRAGGKKIEFREYPDVEHMVIVQAAIADAFAFFDRQANPEP
ncbi:MAG: hypothetical protein JNL67_10580 [Planctomycetaceae bacterium]|nr:hypothetical protein [Planctomycetaceae bacterium]